MREKKAYYAHSKRKYNTSEEAEELTVIEKHFQGKVICPNKDLGELGSIELYLNVIQSTICVYVSEYRGYIGRGVFDECTVALTNEISIFVIRQDNKGEYFIQEVTDVVEARSSNLVLYGLIITK